MTTIRLPQLFPPLKNVSAHLRKPLWFAASCVGADRPKPQAVACEKTVFAPHSGAATIKTQEPKIAMPYTASDDSFAGVQENFEKAVDWLIGHGVKIGTSRINTYRTGLSELVLLHSTQAFKQLKQRQGFLMDVLFEVSELNFIHRHLGDQKTLDISEHLSFLSNGPIHRTAERPASASNKARNTAFELVTAASLARVGFTVRMTDAEDIRASLADFQYIVECKRPSSEKQIKNRVREALDQADGRATDMPTIAAIDLSLIANPKHGVIDERDRRSIYLSSGRVLEALIATYLEPSKEIRSHSRAVCVLARIVTLAVDRSQSMPVYAQQWSCVTNSGVGIGQLAAQLELKRAFADSARPSP